MSNAHLRLSEILTDSENYLQNPPGDARHPGTLGLGQSKATTINDAFLLFGYISPLPMAVLSDTRIGRFRTLLLSLL